VVELLARHGFWWVNIARKSPLYLDQNWTQINNITAVSTGSQKLQLNMIFLAILNIWSMLFSTRRIKPCNWGEQKT